MSNISYNKLTNAKFPRRLENQVYCRSEDKYLMRNMCKNKSSKNVREEGALYNRGE